jgi:hypothetical protein
MQAAAVLVARWITRVAGAGVVRQWRRGPDAALVANDAIRLPDELIETLFGYRAVNRQFEIEFFCPGAEAFAFTFG